MQIKKEPIQHGAKLLKQALAATKEAGLHAAKAIMTTDTVPKEAAICVSRWKRNRKLVE